MKSVQKRKNSSEEKAIENEVFGRLVSANRIDTIVVFPSEFLLLLFEVDFFAPVLILQIKVRAVVVLRNEYFVRMRGLL